MASWMVFTGTVCHTIVTSTAVVRRPSQSNLATSYCTAGFLSSCSSATAWVTMPMAVPSRGAWE